MSEKEAGTSEEVTETVDSRESMEEQMSAVYDKMQAEEAPPEVVTEPENQQEASESDDRPRGPDGKFIAKEAAPEATTEPADPAQQKGIEAAPPPIEAPISWSAQAKAEWAKLPPAIQQEVLKREGEVAKGFDERAAKLKTYEPIDRILEPVRQQLALSGIGPDQYLGSLIAADQFLRRDPGQAIGWIANQYGIDLQKFAQQQVEQAPADPTVAALQRQVQDLTTNFQTQLERQQQDAQSHMLAQIEAFKADPKHKYAEEVMEDMTLLAQAERAAGRQPNLESLYDRAVWANPEVRAKLTAEQKAAEEATRKAEAEKRAKDAKRINGANLTSRGTAAGETPKKASMEEEMSEVYDRMEGAA